MKPISFTLTLFFSLSAWLAVWLALPGSAAADSGLTPDMIVEKANHVALYQGDSMKGRIRMEIKDKQGRTRKRVLNILRRDAAGPGDLDQKYFTYFKTPADVRKMVFMVHKHADPGIDDDRWLYMPGLDLVKRIAAGDKRTSFVGSDFLYEDISGRGIHEDTHELIQTTDRHYVLKNTPKDPGAVEFAYYLAYIDKTRFITDKMEFYKKPDILYRVMSVLKVEDITAKGKTGTTVFPTVVESMVKSIETGSVTRMTLSKVAYNVGLSKDIFSERFLRRPPRGMTR